MVVLVRVIDGVLKKGMKIQFLSNKSEWEVTEVGVFRPRPDKVDRLSAGEVGYVATGLKSVRDCQVGDTLTSESPEQRTMFDVVREAQESAVAKAKSALAVARRQSGDDSPEAKAALETALLDDFAGIRRTANASGIYHAWFHRLMTRQL